jgi:hypothetical protein
MADASFPIEKITNDGHPAVPGRGEAMHSDIWYDLAIRELSDLSDPATEKLVEAAAENLPMPTTDDEEPAPAEPKTAKPDAPSRG